MAITALGKYLKQLRADHDERLYDMAKKIGVSSAFLSGIENGHKQVSSALLNKISETYSLNAQQRKELTDCLVN